MNILKLLIVFVGILLTPSLFAAEVQWSERLEDSDIYSGSFTIVDGDYNQLNANAFVDAQSFGYLRLGIEERLAMDFTTDHTYSVDVDIIGYDSYGGISFTSSETLLIEYLSSGAYATVDGQDFRMPDIHKFKISVTAVYQDGGPIGAGSIPNYLYLEGGIYAERYYTFNQNVIPTINAQLIEYDQTTGAIAAALSGTTTDQATDEIYLNWAYVNGAEYYDLEWTWVDNYYKSGIAVEKLASTIAFSEQDFKNNCTRIRTSDQHYSIPNIFGRGYLIYRVRGVGRWSDEVTKDLYGRWSSESVTTSIDKVGDWPDKVKIAYEHEDLKNWQYQSTYAEEGKKKEVTQYFDGSLRGRQTVTRINTDNQAVIGETIYDNEGRGVIQMLPTPVVSPSIEYYPNLNLGPTGDPYNHQHFDWHEQLSTECTTISDPLLQSSGAGEYYSGPAHTGDDDWQQFVPESYGYPYSQVEYTPDNTGRIRNQSGVGIDHRLGSGQETRYYYLQPTQEDLNRLFGYKVGFKSRYKKNMVIDANGQVSISYLDAQGRVIATSLAGETPYDDVKGKNRLDELPSASSADAILTSDLLNNGNPYQGSPSNWNVDDELDDNKLISTGQFGAISDGLELNTQLGVTSAQTYNFDYQIEAGAYEEYCDLDNDPTTNDTEGIKYRYVYDLIITLKDDCGNDVITQTIPTQVGTEEILTGQSTFLNSSEVVPFTPYLEQGSYTLTKRLTVNQAALDSYVEDYFEKVQDLADIDGDGNTTEYLYKNACIDQQFDLAADADCYLTCDQCDTEYGANANEYMMDLANQLNLPIINGPNGLPSDYFTAGEITEHTNVWTTLHDACANNCESTSFCEVFGIMLANDMKPGRQYGGLSGSDPLSVYYYSNVLPAGSGAYYQTPATPYVDQFGNDVKFDAYYVGGGLYTLTDNGTPLVPNILPGELLLADFVANFQASWAESLIPYHPEYPLYEYASEICTSTSWSWGTSPWSVDISSEEFDRLLRQEVMDYSDATNINGVNLVSTTDPLYDQDPYFHIDYGVHSNFVPLNNDPIFAVHTLKQTLMTDALANYKQTGMTMLNFAVKSALYANDFTVGDPGLTWSSVSGLPAADQNAIWEKYKYFYLSYKAEINQLFMDFHGYRTQIFNGCIGNNAYGFGIVPEFAGITTSTTFAQIMQANAWLLANNSGVVIYPWQLCLDIYDDKEIRIVRIDVNSTPGMSYAQQGANMAQGGDYSVWDQTGLCPLVFDLEQMLNAMTAEADNTGVITSPSIFANSTPQNSLLQFNQDLYEAFNGVVPTNTNSTISGNIAGTLTGPSAPFTGSGLVISITGVASTAPTIEITNPTNSTSGTMLWSQLGSSWEALEIYHTYPTGNPDDEAQIVILIDDDLVSSTPPEEFIATYRILNQAVAFNICPEAEDPNNDPTCHGEQLLEDGILDVLQNQISLGNLYTPINIDISSDTYFLNSYLDDFIGANPDKWSGVSGNSFSIGDLDNNINYINVSSLSTSFPAGNFYVTYVDLDIPSPSTGTGNITIGVQEISATGTTYDITGTYSYYQYSQLAALDVSCPCDPVVTNPNGDYTEMLNLVSAFFNDIISVGTIPANYQPISLFNLAPYGIYPLYYCSMNGGDDFSADGSCVYLDQVSSPHTITLTDLSGNAISSPLSSPLVGMTSFSYTNGAAAPLTATCFYLDGTSEVMGIDVGSLVGFYPDGELPCSRYDCNVNVGLQGPMSCTDEYSYGTNSYVSQITSFYGGPFTVGSPEETEFLNEILLTEEEFCNAEYAYILDAYVYYLNNATLALTGPDDPRFVTLTEFGATPLGYSNTLLMAAVDNYVASIHYIATNNPNYIDWNNYVAEIYMGQHPTICPAPTPNPSYNVLIPEPPCNLWEEQIAAVNNQNQETIFLEQMKVAFIQSYVESAIASVKEYFTETHNEKEYHYTLYYYDRAGNLVKTVPPNGTDRMEYSGVTPVSNAMNGGYTAATHAEINEFRENATTETALDDPSGLITGRLAPDHTHETDYHYNSLNQLVYQKTPDGGESRFAYDDLGRLVMSQNDKQAVVDQFSYTKYDALGRVVEVGEMTMATTGYGINDYGHLYLNSVANEINAINSSSFPDNLSTDREEVTRTIYDEMVNVSIPVNIGTSGSPVYSNVSPQAVFGANYAWDNTRNRIVAVIYLETLSSSNPSSNLNYESGLFYDYDVHGNVSHLIQVYADAQLKKLNQHIKHVEYEYDLVSGNVDKVTFQKGEIDQYIHKYSYDSDNRIIIAETSKDGVFYEKDAKYFYYDHGPLARTELAEQKVQGFDYAYTIQGWLKTVNGEDLDPTLYTMGEDGKVNNLNNMIGQDALGFSLSYFDRDYSAANTNMLAYSPGDEAPPLFQLGVDLYNGNIRAMYTPLMDENQNFIATHQTQYQYDQLNRIRKMDGNNTTFSSPGVISHIGSNYNSDYTFDANGNLLTLNRTADLLGTQTQMDNFSYIYNDVVFNNGENNRLTWVDDAAGNSVFGDADIDDSQNAGNYTYDEIGQLIQDNDEGLLYIDWKVTNKVEEIGRDTDNDGNLEKVIHFDYDPMGNRIAKHEYDVLQNSPYDAPVILFKTSTYYYLNAQGNSISIYDGSLNNNVTPAVFNMQLAERHMYGSSRVGIENVNEAMGFVGIDADEIDLSSINTVSFCSTVGWNFEDLPIISSYNSSDFDSDGDIDLEISHLAASAYSARYFFNTIPGQYYTVSYNIDELVGDYSNGIIYECDNSAILNSHISVAPEAVILSFTAVSSLTQLKLFNGNGSNPSSPSHVTISNLVISGPTSTNLSANYYADNVIGDKRYELSNHLGNVLEVVTDRKLPIDVGSNGDVDYFTADVVTYADYYPFGMVMPNRNYSSPDYRYGFQGQESDDEVKGNGNSVNYKYRMHDPRVGRFFAVDPLTSKYPHNSPYAFSENVVIDHVELEGLEKAKPDGSPDWDAQFGVDPLPANPTPGDVFIQQYQRNKAGLNPQGTGYKKPPLTTAQKIKRTNINFFKSFYPAGGVTRNLIEHYGYGNGEDYHLNDAEIAEVFPNSDWSGNDLDLGLTAEEFASYGDKLFGGSRDYSKEDIEAYSGVAGALGRTYVDIKGSISEEIVGGKSTLVFRGKVTFYDEYNFDASDRPLPAEILTAIGRNALMGDSFKIYGEIDVVQYEGQDLEFKHGDVKPATKEK